MAADATQVQTVTVELSYDDALRLWVLVHDPAHAGDNRADERIRKLVHDAVSVTEGNFEALSTTP